MAEPLAPAAPAMGARLRRPHLETTLVLAVLLAMLAALPLAAPGYFFNAHDARHSVFFLVEYDQAMHDGALWPLWAPDQALGFGYPLWLVYSPLAYLTAEIFHLLGLGFVAAVKTTWALGFLLAAAGAYYLARRWWGRSAGLIAALAYSYAPYHLVQIYVRADLAEFMAWAWFPWVMLSLISLWERPRPRSAALAGLALGVLLLLHTVSPLIFAPFLVGFILLKLVQGWRADRRFPFRPLLRTAAAAILGGALASVFLLPALLELRYVVSAQFSAGTYDYTLHFVSPGQFLSPFWGYGYSVAGTNDGMSFQLGLLPFLGAIVGVGAALRGLPGQDGARGVRVDTRRQAAPARDTMGMTRAAGAQIASVPRRPFPHRAEALFLLAAGLGALFMMTGASAAVWRVLPFGSMIQFPWRLLGLTMLAFALLAGAGAAWLEAGSGGAGKQRGAEEAALSPAPMLPRSVTETRPSAYVYVAALAFVMAGFSYAQPQMQPVRPQDESPLAVIEFETTYKDMRGMTAWSERKPAESDSPLLAQYAAGEPLQRAAILSGDGTVVAQGAGAASAWATVDARSPVRLRFYSYYFPGWQATMDGRPAALTPDAPLGLIGLEVPAGQHEVRLRFGATPLRRAAGGISLAALAVALALFALDRRKSPSTSNR